MKKLLFTMLSVLFISAMAIGQNAWINELHYDNGGSDVGEFVEIVIENPGSYTLSDFAVYLYNGSNGTTYANSSVDNFTVGTTEGNYTFYYWDHSGIQNGSPDGLCLSYNGTVISGQFLSYEGTLTATDGPANGMTSVDIGVSEGGGTQPGESLQLSGTGSQYSDFTWQPPATDTKGAINTGQAFGTPATVARIVGDFQGWNTTDPDYVMSENANGLYELTHAVTAGDYGYKVIEGDDWSDPNYPASDEPLSLTQDEDVTWKVNIDADLVIHMNPTITGDFISELGGTDWDPATAIGEMTDPDGDDVYTVELQLPAGTWQCKVVLNQNWNQSTGGNLTFISDGTNPTTFTYDFPNNVTTASGPPPPTATITFIVDDSGAGNYDGFYLKGSWDADGNYDPSWDGGAEHSAFYDDGTNGDAVAGDHIWTCQQDLVVDGGSNTWEWGVNDTEHNWIAGNWQFTVPDETAQTLTWTVPEVPALVINEIMYNSPGGDEEWIELYNNTADAIDLENFKVVDNDASHSPIIIPAGYSIAAGGYFTIEISTSGDFPFTPDYDGSGNFGLGNGGDAVRIWNADGILTDIVVYDDGDPWPTAPDGDGPTLSLLDPDLDNSLAESWAPSLQDGGTPGELNFPPVPYITVLDPNGGEYIQQGSQYTITWTYGNWDGNIEIQIFREGGPEQLIVHNLPVSDGSFTWDVWNSIEVADDYKIVIRNIDDSTPVDESDDYFSIIPPYEIPNLVITEIMYNPPESGEDSLEFIELYNNSLDTVQMEGFHFTEGVEFIFPEAEILPDTFLLVAKNAQAMMNTFGVESLQWTAGALSNGGEDIELQDNYDNVVDYVDYDDSPPWDTLPDGNGPSLTLCNPDLDNSLPENWTHSVYFAAVNADGDSIWATPGFGCQVGLMANFTADTTLISVGDSVMFTDESIGDVTIWLWTFEGGTPATFDGQQPPYIHYDEAGTWDVTLVVSDGTTTDSITKTDYITVNEAYELLPPENLTGEEVNMDIVLSWEPPGGAPTGFEDDFESYDDFVLEFAPWTNIDVDGSTTYGMQGVDWPNAYAEQAFIIFNPSMTTPPVEDMPPHSGDKLAACFAATTPPNDDWLVTPLVNLADDSHVSFWAKSYTDEYGLERFRVGVSTTGLDPADFTIISDGDYVEAPVEDWTEFTYDLSAYNGQQVYVGIQCVSNDAFILLIDDVYIGADKSSIAYNPAQPVVGKGVKVMNYTALPAPQPAVVPERALRDDPVLEGYNVYRDDAQINENVVEGTTYTDIEPSIGSHDYYVTAVYDVGESEPSNVFSIVYTGISEMTSESIVVYPNPSNGKFTVNLPTDIQVELNVMDLTGKTVYRAHAEGSAVIDLSRLYKGMYLLNIYDVNSQTNVVKKLIVK